MHNIAVAILAAVCGLIGGCKTDVPQTSTTKSTNTYAVVVGMETSRFAGNCPGAGYDADRMYKLLCQYTPNAVLLRDGNATKAAVTAALTSAIAKAGNGLVVFFYSGHGGSEPFGDTSAEETDGKDEFYCLYDTYMRDNDMWKMIRECRGRIMLINDCCHSSTLYRHPNISLSKAVRLSAMSRRDGNSFSMLCWSGCPDDTYSYGASTGGQFTNALLRHFDSKKTYDYLWNEIKSDKTLRQYEDPQRTVIGRGFDGKAIFQ